MRTIVAKTFEDLMDKHTSAEIINLYGRNVVRRLTVIGNDVRIDPNTPENPNQHRIHAVPIWTPTAYDPWFMDRGSIMFKADGEVESLKLCTEFDIIRFDDGEATIAPHPDCPKESHEVVVEVNTGKGTTVVNTRSDPEQGGVY